jgi:hypothetical protein
MKTKVFFFHYNKPESKKQKQPIISLHYNKTCYLVHNVVVNVPTHGRIRSTQPFFVMAGKAQNITIKDNIAYIS